MGTLSWLSFGSSLSSVAAAALGALLVRRLRSGLRPVEYLEPAEQAVGSGAVVELGRASRNLRMPLSPCESARVMEGFEEWAVEVAPEIRLHGRSGGDGPAVVLLHGHPRAHTTWHRVAPALAQRGLTVVCPDLRGYGRSSKPPPDERHERYCDRTMAHDVVALMAHVGHERFAVTGHDRGQGVAYRTALDHPERVTALAVLDGLPHVEQAERVDAKFATQWWHWFFFAGSPHAERVIDLEHDRQDRAEERRITCPTLVGWSVKDDMEDLYGDLVPLWEPWVSGPISRARIDSGHHMAEENPQQLAQVLGDLLLTDLR